MAKKIRIIPDLDESKLRQQLNEIGKRREKITVDVNSENISNADQNIKRLNNTAANSNSVFGKLKSTISNTFSSGKLAITGYVAALNEINKAAKNAKQSIEEISEATMNLQVSSGLAREQVQGLIKDYNAYGKSLGATTTQITDAADSYLRSGKTLAEADALIKDSIMLSKLGKLDSATATNDILAVMNGYNMSIDEVNKALDTMIKLDMSAAVSSGEIAQAMQYVASNANAAGISFDKLASMIAVVRDRTRQSAESIGTAFNTIISRYKDITIGKFLDSDGEEIGNTEEALRNLGVELRDENKEFREFEVVLDEVAKSWDTYSSVQQAAISKQLAGTRQQNKFIALVENYNKVLELTEVAANSAGVAVEKFNDAYMNSLEAKQNQLQNSFESLVINTNFEEVYAGILDMTKALVDFINQTNALKGALTGLTVAGGIKGFLAIKTGINEAYIALNKFQNALNIVKKSNISTKEYERLLLLSNGLSTCQMKLVLSTNSLTVAQKKELLMASGLSEEEAVLQLQTWKMTAANTGLTASTVTLGNAFKALWSTLIANPLVIVTALISGVVMAYQAYNQKLEEIRRKNIESATAASENADALKDLYNEYKRLASIQDRTTSEEEAFRTAVENITVALGDKAEVLKDLTAGTDEYADALARVTKEELQSQAVAATIGRKSAEETLQSEIWDKWKGSQVTIDSNDKGKALSDEAQKAVDIVSDSLKEFETINRTWKNISWDISSSDDPIEALEYYNSLIEAREKLVLASKDDEALLDTEIYKDLNTAINTMSESLDTYIEKLYEEEKLNYMAQNGIPSVTEEYKAMESALVDAAGSSVDLQDKFKELLTADFSSLATNIENVGDAVGHVSAQAEKAIPLFNQLTTSEEALDQFQASVKSAKEAYTTLLSGNYSSTELLDSIQTINKAVSDMGGSLNWEFINSQTNSLGLLGDAIEHISEKYAESVLSGAGIDVNSEFGQMLADMIQKTFETEAAFEGMNAQLDNLQSSYQSLTNILESYNETGYISLDNLQSLLTADENLIQMLEVENGQLVINQSAYENLVAVQLLEFKAKLDDAAAAEIEALAKQKAEEATNNNADASNNAVTKLDAETQAFNRNTSAAIANAVAKAEQSGVSSDDIEDIFDKYNKVWEAAQKNYKADFSGFMGNTKKAAKETKKEVDVMAELNSEMDKLQSAYKSLCDIKDTYNKYGKITVDQYQELTNMGFNFLAQLVDENGELGLNANAFEKLAQAKLEEMQIQMARNAIDTINGLKSETEATEYLTYANENLRDAALSATEALLYQAQAAAHLRGEQQGLAADQVVQGYEASKQLAGKVDFFFNPSEKEKESKEDKTDELLEAYNKEKALLEHMLAMDEISKKEYYDKLLALAKQYFEGDEEHQDQLWDAEEAYHEYMESIKKTYNWIEIFLENLAKKTNALIDKAGKFISWAKKNAMINRAVKATDKEITGQTNAYSYYAEKARKVGLSNTYIDKIQNGNLTIEDMQNEALSDKIERYQEWYNQMIECEDAISELYDQERDLIKQKLDNVLSYYDDLDSYMSSIVSKMDSFISLMDDMGKRSSLSDLLEQFAAANDQIAHFQSQTTTTKKENDKNYFDISKRVEAAKKEDTEELIKELTSDKNQIATGIQNTGTYKKLLKDIAKAQLAYDKQYDKLWAIDPNKDKNGKKSEAAQKKLDKLSEKLSSLVNKKDDLEANATANNVVSYSKIYDQYMKLYNKREALEEKGKELSATDTAKMESLFDQMVAMGKQRDDAIKELENQIGIADGSKEGTTEAEKIQKQIKDIDDGVKNSATYQNLAKNIDTVQAKIDKFWNTHDSATKAQQKQLDKWETQLAAYYEKQKQLEENATADTVGEYSKIYDAWRKLQDKLDVGKVLSVAEYKNYNKYNEQLEQFAKERSSIVESLENQLDKALNPGDKITNINREYEEAAEGIYESYQSQIDNIDSRMRASKQYQDLLAKKQNLENIRDTKGLSASQEKTLKKYTEELEALEKGGTGDNITNYIKAWEQFYKLQEKINKGKKLSSSEAATYDSLKSQLDAWNRDKQTQISDLIDLMNDDLEKLRETNAENIAEAEAEINSYYSKIYELAKQIAEYNVNALKEQLAYLDAYISYYKDLVSLYDKFSGDKLSKLFTDLDEDAFNDQIKVYEKYLATLQSKYDATISEINEYKQLIDAIDTNDFQASMDLFQKAMDNYKSTGNTEMEARLQSVLDLLNERAVDADNWEEYADLWLNEWEQALADGKSQLIETAEAIQEINDALRDIRFSNITDALEELTRASNILASISGLIQDSWLYEGDGLSEYGQAKVALLVSQLENAQVAANEYLEMINRIQESEDTYASDKAYQDALAEATQNYWDAMNNAADIENNIVDIMKKAQAEELSNWKDIISARKEALQSKRDYYSYDRTIKDKNKNIESLKAELAALNEVTTAEAKARRAKLEAQLKEAEEDLADTKKEHEFSISIDALDDYTKKLEDALNDSSKTVQESLESQKEIIDEAKDLYRTATDSVNDTMDKIVQFYSGMGMSIDGADYVPKGSSSGTVSMPSISVNAGGSSKAITEQSTEKIVSSNKNTADQIIGQVKSSTQTLVGNTNNAAGQVTGQMKSSTQNVIDSMKNEKGEIITSIGKLVPVKLPDYADKLVELMSDRLVPDLGGIHESIRKMENYQVNNNNQPVEIVNHYDALLKVEGNVDKDALPELKQILEESYQYTTKKIFNDAAKIGVRIRR